MDSECGHYLLSETAARIWKQADEMEEGKMFACFVQVHKASFFKQVLFSSKWIPENRMFEMAQDVFLQTWAVFATEGRAGRLQIRNKEYKDIFFVMFKRAFIKTLGREIRNAKVEKAYGLEHHYQSATVSKADEEEVSEKINRALKILSESCRQLLIWRYIENLSHEEIAGRRNIGRKHSIQAVYRCGKRFSEIWKKQNQKD